MTSSAMSAFESSSEVKTSPHYAEAVVSSFEQSQSPDDFFQPCQSSSFNPFVYFSNTQYFTSNSYPTSTNSQQSPNSTSASQNNQPKLSPFSCRICGKEFGMRCRLTAHIRRHTGERPFSCAECGRFFADAGNLRRHRYVHSSEPRFHCTVCGQPFRQASCLSTHRRFLCPGAEGLLCVFCQRHFKSSASLQTHLRFKHRADAADIVAVAPRSMNSEDTAYSMKGAKDSQQQHQALPSPLPVDPTNKDLGQVTGNGSQGIDSCYHSVPIAAADVASSTADRCRKTHIHKQSKVEKVAVPTLEGITAEQLMLVVSAVTGGIGGVSPGSDLDAKGRAFNFICPACPRRFVFQCRLAAHLRSHTNFRPFICPDCGRAFTQRGYLVRHAVVHANERPFACSLCARAYKHYGSLANHRRTHSVNPETS